MGQQPVMLSYRNLVFLILWPLVILLIALLVINSSPAHLLNNENTSTTNIDTNNPSGVVKKLWAVQQSTFNKYQSEFGGNRAAELLDREAQLTCEQNSMLYVDKQIDSETKINADKWRVKTTYTIAPGHRTDDKQTESRIYMITKDAGKLKISEVKTECPRCDGKGYKTCYMCDGKGVDYDGSRCETCGGTGKELCENCKQTGWINLIKDGTNYLSF